MTSDGQNFQKLFEQKWHLFTLGVFYLKCTQITKKVSSKTSVPDLVKFFIKFENKLHFIMVPSPPIKVNFNLSFYFIASSPGTDIKYLLDLTL